MGRNTTVGNYLIGRLEEAGLKHVFGVPGDYVLRFYDLLVESRMEVIGTCAEAGAGFAADAYARVNGLGAVCITYCVGGFNVLNSVAGAYAEKSPLVVISGAPGLHERARTPLLHHRVRGFDTQRRVFEPVTVAAEALEDPSLAPRQIDEALDACLRHKRPVYLELPRDMVDEKCPAALPMKPVRSKSDPDALAEALEEASSMLRSARRPVVLAGVEIHRFRLQEALIDLIERTGFPVAATLLGKSIIRENHPQYLGIYEGAMGRDDVRTTVEKADCVLVLGAFMTDINLGIYTAHLDVSQTINATSEQIAIKHHRYDGVDLKDFIRGLVRADTGPRRGLTPKRPHTQRPFRPQTNRPLSVTRFFARMNDFLEAISVVICDIGDSLFGAADLTIHRQTEFISPAYYTSMGFAIPAALGAQINKRNLRPIVFVGDGAFQMTGQELSTIARHGLNPIVFVINNGGYATERMIHDGPYNDIPDWAYHKWPEVLGAGWGCDVRTEGELEKALNTAHGNSQGFSIINAHFASNDCSNAMGRLGKRLGRSIPSRK